MVFSSDFSSGFAEEALTAFSALCFSAVSLISFIFSAISSEVARELLAAARALDEKSAVSFAERLLENPVSIPLRTLSAVFIDLT